MQRCASCGAENPLEARFCGDCGATLEAPCRNCGAATQPGKRFCIICGAPLAPAAGGKVPSPGNQPSQPPGKVHEPRVSERRVCSVLFADLVGFTQMSQNRDPEEVREVLSRYFEVARQLITRYGGTVEKFIGDAVMAVWGTPIASEGDTERAVRAALELVGAVEVLGAEVGAPGLRARAGIVTGEVAVTIGASGQGMVAGDAVNTASRAQSVAAPGSVLVDETTKKLAERAIAFEDGGTYALKGKEAPEHLLRALRVLSGVGGKQRADGLEAPFTGRDAELRGLKDLFHTAVERRTPRLVVVPGPAGVGKSRLAWEFYKYIDGLADTVLWHRGRCLSYGEGVAFWALAEIVRQRFGIAEEDPVDVAQSKLVEGMVRFVSDEAEREYIGVRLSRLLGVPYPSGTRVVLSQDELYAGWRLFFERLAEVAPVVLLLEDVHHADESLLGFFGHLIDWTRDRAVFVVLFGRPGHAAIDAGYGVGRNRSTLSLDPLDDASMSELVGALVPGMPTKARDTITARAQGIPLFAVETVRSLIDQGIVGREDDTYRLVGEIGELSVPGSLHALLAARLDALPAEARSLVADACVLGSTFPKDALVAISQGDPDAVGAGLSELVRRDVLHVISDPLSPERGSYRFGQEMLRQVAYETLSKRDRKARHLAVASHLRSTFANEGEEIADAIAHHYLDALAAAPGEPDAEDIASQALSFLVRAAERAERSGAPGRAAENYGRAAVIAPGERAAVLFERAAEASSDAGDVETAIMHADAARERYLALGDQRCAARAQSAKGQALQAAGRYGDARSELTQALDVLRPLADADTVRALGRLASLASMSGNADEAERLASEALALGQALDVGPRSLARLFLSKGGAAGHGGRLVESAAHLETVARLAERAGDFGTVAIAQANLADVLPRAGDLVGAVEAARSAAAHARRTGRWRALAFALANLTVALLELGQWQEADAVLHDALGNDLHDQWLFDFLTGWLAGWRGDAVQAASSLRAIGAKRQSEDPQTQAIVASLEALVSLCNGDVPSALSYAMRVLDMAEVIGIASETQRWVWPLAARAARILGDTSTLAALVAMLDAHPLGHLPPILRAERRLAAALTAADADAPEGVALVREAIAGLRDAGNPYQLGHALIDLAEVLVRSGEDGSDVALSEATEIAERLGCPPLAERAASVTSTAERTGTGRAKS